MRIDPNRNEKKCSLCDSIKERKYFYTDKNRKDNMTNYCKECSLKRNKRWRDSNPKVVSESSLWTRRKIFYGITKEEFYEMMEKQNHQCAICKISIDRSSHVDHCHSTGKVRGILCMNCNKGLGFFKDNTENIQSAIEYLKLSIL